MSSGRIPLKPGSTVAIGGNTYRICGLLSDNGGSCLAYNAEREPSGYEKKISMPSVPAVIKEFYPAEYAGAISRCDDGTYLSYTGFAEVIGERMSMFVNSAIQQVEFYDKSDEHSFAPARIDEANNTVYTVVDRVRGDTLDNAYNGLSRYDKSEVLISLCGAIVQLHRANKLYLDIKPSNIWLFTKSEQSRRVALFDFDTVLPTDDSGHLLEPYPQKIPYSESWSPREQQTPQQYGSICRATDVYAFGAVIYWLYTGKMVDANAVNKIKLGDFEFLDANGVFEGADRLKENIKEHLSTMLSRSVKNRQQSLESLLQRK